MSDEESLTSILSNDASPEPVATEPVAKMEANVEAEPAKATDSAQTRDPSGKFAKSEPEPAKAEAKVEQPKTPEQGKPSRMVPEAALLDERRKRQEAEQRLHQQPPPAKPSVFEDEDAAISSRVAEQVAPIRQALFHQSLRAAKLAYGEAYGEAETAFVEAAESDPRLAEALRAAPDPGEFVYSEGLRIKELAEVGGDFRQYREKLTTEHTAKLKESEARVSALQAEIDALKKANADLESLPRSLNRAASGSPTAGEEDEEGLESIVRFNPRKSG